MLRMILLRPSPAVFCYRWSSHVLLVSEIKFVLRAHSKWFLLACASDGTHSLRKRMCGRKFRLAIPEQLHKNLPTVTTVTLEPLLRLQKKADLSSTQQYKHYKHTGETVGQNSRDHVKRHKQLAVERKKGRVSPKEHSNSSRGGPQGKHASGC
jgi:hypothetical protein